jgi:hypothetical protein
MVATSTHIGLIHLVATGVMEDEAVAQRKAGASAPIGPSPRVTPARAAAPDIAMIPIRAASSASPPGPPAPAEVPGQAVTDPDVMRHARTLLDADTVRSDGEHPAALAVLRDGLVEAGDIGAART